MSVQAVEGGAAQGEEDHLHPILHEADGYLPRFARAATAAVPMGRRVARAADLAEEAAVRMDLALFEACLDDKVETVVGRVGSAGPGTVSALDYAECWQADLVRGVSFTIQGTVLPVGLVCRADGVVLLTRLRLCNGIEVAATGTFRDMDRVVSELAAILLEMMPRHSVH